MTFFRLLLASVGISALGCGGTIETLDPIDTRPPPEDALVLETAPIHLAPGDEMYRCQYFPPSGDDRWIDGFSVPRTVGLHHLFVFRMKDDAALPAEPSPCPDDLSGRSEGMFPAEHGGSFTLPEGVAFSLAAGEGLLFQMHLIDTTAAPLDVRVTWTARLAPAAGEKAPAGMLLFANHDIDLPPHQDTTVTKTCPAPIDAQLFGANGHFHDRAFDYEASVAGTMVLDVKTGDASRRFDPTLPIQKGDPITWSCFDRNTGADDVVFGPSLLKNEMCNFAGYIFPVPGSATFRCP